MAVQPKITSPTRSRSTRLQWISAIVGVPLLGVIGSEACTWAGLNAQDTAAWTGAVAVCVALLFGYHQVEELVRSRHLQTETLQAQTFLSYIERMEATRSDRSLLRARLRKLSDVERGNGIMNTVTFWQSEYAHHIACIESTNRAPATGEASAAADRPDLWQAADRVTRAYDLLGAAYDCKIVNQVLVDRMYTPILYEFWDTWMRGFIEAECERRGQASGRPGALRKSDPKHLCEARLFAQRHGALAWRNQEHRAGTI